MKGTNITLEGGCMKQVRILEAFILAFNSLKKYPMLLLAPSIVLNLLNNGLTLVMKLPAFSFLTENIDKLDKIKLETFIKHFSPTTLTFFLVLAVIIIVVTIVLSIILQIGYIRISIHLFDKKTDTPSWNFYNHFGLGIISKYFWASLLLVLIILGGFIFLIVPALILSFMFQFMLFVLVEKDSTISDAFKKSNQLTNGIKWQLFAYALLQGFLTILVLLPIMLLENIPYIYLPLNTIVVPIVGMFFTLAGIFIYKDIASQVENSESLVTDSSERLDRPDDKEQK
jgi:hypothetical protein